MIATGVVDCDLHNVVPSVQALFPYLSDLWREHISQTLFKGAIDPAYPKNAPTSARPGSVPSSGPAGPTSACCGARSWIRGTSSSESSAAPTPSTASTTRTRRSRWRAPSTTGRSPSGCDKDPRLRASIVCRVQLRPSPPREIERVGDHPGFVQVLLPVRTQHPSATHSPPPLGSDRAQDLVAGDPIRRRPGNPPTPSGWPSYYFEEYVGMAQVFATQLTSIVGEGVFDRSPA